VFRGGPADKAGVKPGDVLTEIEGKLVIDPAAMLNLVAALAPGSAAKMKLKRQGRDVEASITVGPAAETAAARGITNQREGRHEIHHRTFGGVSF